MAAPREPALTLEEAAVASEGGLDNAAVVDARRQVHDERQAGHQQGAAPGVHRVQPETLSAGGPLVGPADGQENLINGGT